MSGLRPRWVFRSKNAILAGSQQNSAIWRWPIATTFLNDKQQIQTSGSHYGAGRFTTKFQGKP
jgi:hypothetical protein